jgi:hypothetical protein
MKRRSQIGAVLLGLALSSVYTWAQTDQQIKQILIRESIARYSGSCPCPYNTDRAGRRCGGRSEYSRPGGAAPLCYESDVTQRMVDQYREAQKQRQGSSSRQ